MASKMTVVSNKEKIINVLETKSQVLTQYLSNNENSEFILYYKYLTHSDLPTFGKATRVDRHCDNLLYYITTEEIEAIEQREGKPFATAHQSNITLPVSFWENLGMENPRNTVNWDVNDKRINKYADVLLVNENIEYFSCKYTKELFSKLGKQVSSRSARFWVDNDIDLNLSSDDYTHLQLTQAVHGLGISEDVEFSKLRHHMFKNDMLFLLIEKSIEGTKLFVLPIKNPKFFTLVGLSNTAWEQYQHRENEKAQKAAVDKEIMDEIVNRNYQDKWRNLLAEEMMNFTLNENEVFCPMTYISANFNNVGTIYRASHIKSFSDSSPNEKYDINNGLLLVANADALFDKHLITINENKELIFSFLLEHDFKLRGQLLLNQPLFKDVLNEERMEYLKYHHQIFIEKEQKRRVG